MKDIFFVGIGGMIGSISRYLLSKNLSFLIIPFPLGIFLINIIGCFIAGITYKFIMINKGYDSALNMFLLIGFCGGFTTFSAFSLEAINILNNNKIILMIAYTVTSSIMGILFCYLGMNILK